MHSGKGVSTLIATAIVILVTIVLAGILYQGLLSFTGNSNERIDVQSRETINCSYASLSIDSVVVNRTTQQASITLSNNGRNAIGVVSAAVFSMNGSACNVWNATALNASDVDTKTVSCAIFASCSDVSHARADTNCNGVSATAKESIICE